MRTFWRVVLGLVLLITVLGTLAVAGMLSWLADQETVRVIVDGQAVSVKLPSGWGFVGILAAVALGIVVLLTVVPVIVVVALVVALVGTVLGGLFAMAPVLIVAGLIWWLVQRSRQPS